MSEAWIQIWCPECDEQWESSPSDLPAPQRSFTCDHCDASGPTAEFMKTKRGLEILESFHES